MQPNDNIRQPENIEKNAKVLALHLELIVFRFVKILMLVPSHDIQGMTFQTFLDAQVEGRTPEIKAPMGKPKSGLCF